MKEALLRLLDDSTDKTIEFITRHTLKEEIEQRFSRILVAENDSEMQKQLVRCFDSAQFQTDVASDGDMLELAMNQNIYDLILLDLTLPNVDAFDYVKKFRQYEQKLNHALSSMKAKEARIPIIAIGNNTDSALLTKCRSYGLDNLISRPITEEQVQSIVAQYIQENSEVE